MPTGLQTNCLVLVLHFVQGTGTDRHVVLGVAQASLEANPLGAPRPHSVLLVVCVPRRARHGPVDGQHELFRSQRHVHLLYRHLSGLQDSQPHRLHHNIDAKLANVRGSLHQLPLPGAQDVRRSRGRKLLGHLHWPGAVRSVLHTLLALPNPSLPGAQTQQKIVQGRSVERDRHKPQRGRQEATVIGLAPPP